MTVDLTQLKAATPLSSKMQSLRKGGRHVVERLLADALGVGPGHDDRGHGPVRGDDVLDDARDDGQLSRAIQ